MWTLPRAQLVIQAEVAQRRRKPFLVRGFNQQVSHRLLEARFPERRFNEVACLRCGHGRFARERPQHRGLEGPINFRSVIASSYSSPGRCECYLPGDIQDQRDAAGVFQPMIFHDTGSYFLRRASERNVRLPDLEVYVFQRKVHGIDGA
jgi:hypothetical protein